MQTSVVNKIDLERTFRIDGEYYQEKYLHIEKKILSLSNVKTVTELCKVSDGNHMSIAQYFNSEQGVSYYRGQDITDFFLENVTPVLIPENIYNTPLMKRSHFQVGDVLLSIVGTVGNLSLVTDNIKKSTGSCKLAILRPKNIHPEYLATFLMSKYGNEQIRRNTRGAVQTGLILEDFSQIFIVTASDNFQKVIVDIVKTSLSKNNDSRIFYSQAEQILLSELNLLKWKPKQRLSFVKKYSDTESEGRIDAEYFQPMYEEIVKAVALSKDHSSLGELVSIKKCIEPGSEAYQDNGIMFLRVSNLSKFGFKDGNQQYISEDLYRIIKQHQPKQGEILLSKDATPGIAYYLKDNPEKMIPSGGILRLQVKDEDKLYPEYLTLVLNSVIVQKQIERDAGGSIINHWLVGQVKNTVIPILPVTKQKKIAETVNESFCNRELSRQLLDIAKRGIELAIEKEEKKAQKWIDEKLKELKFYPKNYR